MEFIESVNPFIETPHCREFLKESINILGIPYDGTASYRAGARFGPNAIREASINLETYSPYMDKDLSELKLNDMGNLPFAVSFNRLKDIFEKITENLDLIKDNIKILTLGGEHSISYFPLQLYLSQYPELLIIHLDAHADLRDGYLGHHYSHASVIRRALDHFDPGHQLVQYGIRSGTQDEFIWMKENKTLLTSLNDLVSFIQAQATTRPIYLTLDLDFFDPSILPGTGTPEAGGETFHNFIKIIKLLRTKNLVGADVVELAPTIDSTGNSSCFASKIVRELLLGLQPI